MLRNINIVLLVLTLTQPHLAHLPHKPNLESQEERFVEASNAFAVHIYKHLAATDGNIFFCPACLSSSLSMLMEASAGETSAELNRTLQFKRTKSIRGEIRQLYTELTQRMKMTECLTYFTNILFVQKDFDLQPEFAEDSNIIYNTEIVQTDFLGNLQQAVWDVNESVKTKTQGRIKRMFERLDSKNSMLLINAVHFKTKFAGIFDGDRSLKNKFYNHGFEDHDIEIFVMEKNGAFQRIADSYDFRALELPCGEDEETTIKIWIFLPHKMGSLPDVEYGLSTATFRQLRESFRDLAINITIPRIKFDFAKDISKDLQKLGILRAFSENDANFSPLSDMKGLFLSQTLQRAIIDINEKESSYYTNNSYPDPEAKLFHIPPFTANHPFLFCVIDSSTGLILYLGRVFEF